MNRLTLSLFPALILLALFLLSGCESATDDTGVVARVNGRPIALSQLEFQHDLMHMDGIGTFVPSVEALRTEYGAILAELIVLELVEQELEHQGLSVTEEELVQEEAKVRADYPDGAFEQVLVEEYIDITAWRRQLRYDTSKRKFFQKVLRPQVKVDYLEADQYYKEHIKDFLLPASYRLIALRGAQKGLVEKAVAAYRESGDLVEVRRQAQGISVNELSVSAGQISEEWKGAVDSLPEGEVSPVMQSRTGYEALVLLKKLPSTMLGPTQAYPLVEEVLVEQKLSELFEQWLAAEIGSADIQISALLLERQDDEAPAAAPDDEQEEGDDSAQPLEDLAADNATTEEQPQQ